MRGPFRWRQGPCVDIERQSADRLAHQFLNGLNFQCSAPIAKVLRDDIESTISSALTMALA